MADEINSSYKRFDIDDLDLDFYPSWITEIYSKLNQDQIKRLTDATNNGTAPLIPTGGRTEIDPNEIVNRGNGWLNVARQIDKELGISGQEKSLENWFIKTNESIKKTRVSGATEQYQLETFALAAERLDALIRVINAHNIQIKYYEELDKGLEDGTIAEMTTIAPCAGVDMKESPYEKIKNAYESNINDKAKISAGIAASLLTPLPVVNQPVQNFLLKNAESFIEGVNKYVSLGSLDPDLFKRGEQLPSGLTIPIKIGPTIGSTRQPGVGQVDIHDLKDATPFLMDEEVEKLWTIDGGSEITERKSDMMSEFHYLLYGKDLEEYKSAMELLKKAQLEDRNHEYNILYYIKRPVVYSTLAAIGIISTKTYYQRQQAILKALEQVDETTKISRPLSSRLGALRRYTDRLSRGIETLPNGKKIPGSVYSGHKLHTIGHIIQALEVFKIITYLSNGKFVESGETAAQLIVTTYIENGAFPALTDTIATIFPSLGTTGAGVSVAVAALIAAVVIDEIRKSIKKSNQEMVNDALDAERKWLEERCKQKINPDIYRNSGGTVIVPQNDSGLIPVGPTYEKGIDPETNDPTGTTPQNQGGRSDLKIRNKCDQQDAYEKNIGQQYISVSTDYEVSPEDAETAYKILQDLHNMPGGPYSVLVDDDMYIKRYDPKTKTTTYLKRLIVRDETSTRGTQERRAGQVLSSLEKIAKNGTVTNSQIQSARNQLEQIHRNRFDQQIYQREYDTVNNANFSNYKSILTLRRDLWNIPSKDIGKEYNLELWELVKNGIKNGTKDSELEKLFESRKRELLNTKLRTLTSPTLGVIGAEGAGISNKISATSSIPIMWNKTIENSFKNLQADYNQRYVVLNIEDAIDMANCETDEKYQPWIDNAKGDPGSPTRLGVAFSPRDLEPSENDEISRVRWSVDVNRYGTYRSSTPVDPGKRPPGRPGTGYGSEEGKDPDTYYTDWIKYWGNIVERQDTGRLPTSNFSKLNEILIIPTVLKEMI